MNLTSAENDMYLAWIAPLIKEMGFSKPISDDVWHYTNGDGLLGILESGTVYATQAACINDSMEIRQFHNYVINALTKELIKKPRSPELEPFYNLIESWPIRNPAIRTPYYISCFTRRKDDISQWRGYGSGEGGFAINFITPLLLERKLGFSSISSVNYSAETHQTIAEKLAVDMVSFYQKALHSRNGHCTDIFVKSFFEYWGRLIGELAVLTKGKAFAAEDEIRIVYQLTPEDEKRIIIRRKATMMSSHIALSFPPKDKASSKLLPIAEVMIGPSRHQLVSQHSVRLLLQKLDYIGVETTLSEVSLQSA